MSSSLVETALIILCNTIIFFDFTGPGYFRREVLLRDPSPHLSLIRKTLKLMVVTRDTHNLHQTFMSLSIRVKPLPKNHHLEDPRVKYLSTNWSMNRLADYRNREMSQDLYHNLEVGQMGHKVQGLPDSMVHHLMTHKMMIP